MYTEGARWRTNLLQQTYDYWRSDTHDHLLGNIYKDNEINVLLLADAPGWRHQQQRQYSPNTSHTCNSTTHSCRTQTKVLGGKSFEFISVYIVSTRKWKTERMNRLGCRPSLISSVTDTHSSKTILFYFWSVNQVFVHFAYHFKFISSLLTHVLLAAAFWFYIGHRHEVYFPKVGCFAHVGCVHVWDEVLLLLFRYEDTSTQLTTSYKMWRCRKQFDFLLNFLSERKNKLHHE